MQSKLSIGRTSHAVVMQMNGSPNGLPDWKMDFAGRRMNCAEAATIDSAVFLTGEISHAIASHRRIDRTPAAGIRQYNRRPVGATDAQACSTSPSRVRHCREQRLACARPGTRPRHMDARGASRRRRILDARRQGSRIYSPKHAGPMVAGQACPYVRASEIIAALTSGLAIEIGARTRGELEVLLARWIPLYFDL